MAEDIAELRFLNLETLRKMYILCLRERLIDESTKVFWGWLELYTPGRAFFSTTDGHIGLCLPSAQAGDYIVAALGCKTALVLRPIAETSGQFKLMGECFVHGLMENEVFLGSLSELGGVENPWRLEYRIGSTGMLRAIYTNGSVDTQNDPRLGPLPPHWRMRFGVVDDDLHDEEFDADGFRMQLWFENTENGDVTACDPRLTSEALKAKGVNVQDFIIG